MRVMAFTGVLMFMIAAVGAWLYRKRKLEDGALVARDGNGRIAFPYIAATAARTPQEMGRQAWIVQGRPEDDQANSPRLGRPGSRPASRSSSTPLRAVLGVVDFVSCGCAARARPPPREELPEPAVTSVISRSSGSLSSWSLERLLPPRGLGVGMLLPFVPRNEAERGTSIGPVWDGNEVVARGRRSNIRRLPGLGTRPCSRASTSRFCCCCSS